MTESADGHIFRCVAIYRWPIQRIQIGFVCLVRVNSWKCRSAPIWWVLTLSMESSFWTALSWFHLLFHGSFKRHINRRPFLLIINRHLSLWNSIMIWTWSLVSHNSCLTMEGLMISLVIIALTRLVELVMCAFSNWVASIISWIRFVDRAQSGESVLFWSNYTFRNPVQRRITWLYHTWRLFDTSFLSSHVFEHIKIIYNVFLSSFNIKCFSMLTENFPIICWCLHKWFVRHRKLDSISVIHINVSDINWFLFLKAIIKRVWWWKKRRFLFHCSKFKHICNSLFFNFLVSINSPLFL